ncbi:protein FAM200A-like [Acyrthosiphon pisum]|uniref:HAT C-terminal dimerisation domain-containing protein n=1 Tax=Acyrthosiphon pisum TaxID=7029 RepID=A0A8R2FDS6_ACYPI|nr:protein FAM200A-like [Acyrthosiphon pisum]|eukprot:XP_008190240.1 PREDICTED: protein FAM200A-like [Acyrthosiphon pisum]
MNKKQLPSEVHFSIDNLKTDVVDNQKTVSNNEIWYKDLTIDNEKFSYMTEELIELSSDENLRIKFNETTSDKFWISIKSEYPELSKIAVSTLLPFATTYLCEMAFSALTVIKNKYRTKLNVESDLRVAVSNIKPNMETIISKAQA